MWKKIFGRLGKKKYPALNHLANPEQWDDPEWLAIHNELSTYSIDKHCFSKTKEFAYRKGWEWTQCVYGLHKLGVITSEAKALGVGVGHEPLLFYLADRINTVIGVDLYGNKTWSGNAIGGNEADATLLTNMQKFCPRSFKQKHLSLFNMDGTQLSFADDMFDFAWSLSSIEHFGGHQKAQQAICEMARVVKPKGIVCVATEYVLTPNVNTHPEFFTHLDFEKYILNASPNLVLLQPMDYTLPALEYLLDPIMLHLGEDVHRIRHHIILNNGTIQWTSAIVFFRKVV